MAKAKSDYEQNLAQHDAVWMGDLGCVPEDAYGEDWEW